MKDMAATNNKCEVSTLSKCSVNGIPWTALQRDEQTTVMEELPL